MLDGLITFFASHHAIRADKTLRDAGLEAQLIPGPKDLSPNCGTAVRFAFADRTQAQVLLLARNVEIDEIQPYVPRTDGWRKRGRAR